MNWHRGIWFTMSFSLLGVFAGSLVYEWPARWIILLLFSVLSGLFFSLFNQKVLAFFSIFVLLGGGYYIAFNLYHTPRHVAFGGHFKVTGLVTEVTSGLDRQTLDLFITKPDRMKIRLTLVSHPLFRYGDVVMAEGTLQSSDPHFFSLAKDGIYGTMFRPQMILLAHDQGFPLKAGLLVLRDWLTTQFKKVLPFEEATFMSGLTLGVQSEFSKSFRDQLSATGTTHLVALSGYNVAVVANAVILIAGYWFSRRVSYWLASLFIFFFVLMTGGAASVVRAALMASLLLFANATHRSYSLRNIVTMAAFLMVIQNPNVLRYDLGFQLSFLAVLGLAYLTPVIKSIFRLKADQGFFGWRENIASTAGAQIAVFPILISNFGFFSPISFLVNILILPFIPFTMFLGFLISLFSLVSSFLALPIGWLAQLMLGYELWLIHFFTRFSFPITFPYASWFFGFVYYGLLLVISLYFKNKFFDEKRY